MKRYLLDTHVALWWADGSPRLTEPMRHAIEEGSNEVWLSVVNVWEASIKASLGKLRLPSEPLVFFQALADRSHLQVLPVHLSHAAAVYSLPKVHADPFDRLLIGQAREEGLTMISDDAVFEKYDLPGLLTGR